MSEFSDSLHFFHISINDLKEKLFALDLQAFILNEKEEPFAVLMSWEDKIKVKSVADNLDFSFADDHGLSCKFYVDGKLIARANKFWGEDFGIEEPENSPNFPGISIDFSSIISKYNFLSEAKATKFTNIFDKYDCEDWKVREDFITEIGNILELKHYRNLSCEDIKYNLDMLININPVGKINL